jgi:nitrate reductase gamma subunit
MSEIPPPPMPGKKSPYTAILLTMLFGFLLALGSCFAPLADPHANQSAFGGQAYFIGFWIGVSLFLGSISLLVIRAIRDAVKRPGGPS